MEKNSYIRVVVVVTLVAIIFVAGFMHITKSKTIRPNILALVDTIMLYSEINKGRYVTDASPFSNQSRRIERLDSLATYEELLALSAHPYPAIRCYSLDALISRKPKQYLPLVLRQMNNRERFFDVNNTLSFRDYFVLRLNRYAYAGLLDSSWYSTIRDIAVNDYHVQSWPIAWVAQFRKPEDIPLIKWYLDSLRTFHAGLQAVKEFPSDEFFPLLEQRFQIRLADGYSPHYMECDALLHYRHPEVIAMLKNALLRLQGSELDLYKITLGFELKMNPDPYFDEVRDSLHLTPEEQQKVDLWYYQEINLTEYP